MFKKSTRTYNEEKFFFKKKNKHNPNDFLRDVYDGNIYQNLLKSSIGNDIKSGEAFTFLLNTDGISLSQKSKSTIWPVILVINELPIEIRFCIENILIAGKNNDNS